MPQKDKSEASLAKATLPAPAPTPRGRIRAATSGFTLAELMIVVAIVAILAAIAIPSYNRYVLRANRSAAEDVMMSMASAQERFMIDSRQYTTANSDLGYGTLPDTVSPNYGIAMTTSVGPPPGFTITATPVAGSNQANDTDCNVLTLDSNGNKSANGTSTARCWK